MIRMEISDPFLEHSNVTSLDDLALFAVVASEPSMRAAARRLGIPPTTLARRIARLETAVGVPLVRRSTRAFTLTDDGRKLAATSTEALHDLELAIEDLQSKRQGLSGSLRVTAPVQALRDTIGPWLVSFAAEHPALRLHLFPDNRWLNLVSEGIDLAFRVGPLRDSSDRAVKLWDIPYALVAVPALFETYPDLANLTDPAQLENLPAVIAEPTPIWRFDGPRDTRLDVEPQPIARIADLSVTLQAVQSGIGLGYLPKAMIMGTTLQQVVMPDWAPTPRQMFAVMPVGKTRSPRVQAALDYVRQRSTVHFSELSK